MSERPTRETVDLSQYPDLVVIYLGMRVRLAENAVPPPFEILTERARANDTETILFPEVVNLNDSAH